MTAKTGIKFQVERETGHHSTHGVVGPAVLLLPVEGVMGSVVLNLSAEAADGLEEDGVYELVLVKE